MERRVVYFVWGPPRSGTTWLFNVTKEMLSVAHIGRVGYIDGNELPPRSWSESVVIKAHQADPAELVKLFQARVELCALVILRRPDHAFRSLLRTQKASRSELLSWLERDLTSLESTLPALNNVQLCREEWIKDSSIPLIRQLAALNRIPLSDPDVEHIAQKFERENVRSRVNELTISRKWTPDFKNFDPETHWHALHIGPEIQPDLDLSDEEKSRIDALASRVALMTQRHTVWEQVGHAALTLPRTAASPSDYLAARDAALHPRPRRWRDRWRIGGSALAIYAGGAIGHTGDHFPTVPL